MLKIYFIIGAIYTLINTIVYIIGCIFDFGENTTWYEIKDSIEILKDPISTSERKKYARRNIAILGGIVFITMLIGIPLLWPIVLIINVILVARLFIKEN